MTKQNPHQKAAYVDSALKAGLSRKAAAVYVALLEAGAPVSPKGIIVRTGLHRQYVYDAIRELQDRALITSIGKDRSVRYAATNPERLVHEVEKQRIDTLQGVSTLMQLYSRAHAGGSEVVRGSAAIRDVAFKELENTDKEGTLETVNCFGEAWAEIAGERLPEWEALLAKKRIRTRSLGNTNWTGKGESRTLASIEQAIGVAIWPASVFILTPGTEPLLVRIRSKAVAESQRALFEALWNAAK